MQRKSKVKAILSLCIAVIILTSSVSMLAYADNRDTLSSQGTATGIGKHDVWVEGGSRGDNPPTAITTIPYTGSGTIRNYVFSNYMFKPIGTGSNGTNGRITGVFSGTISTGTATVTIKLYNCSTNAFVSGDLVLGPGSVWNHATQVWQNLNVNQYYCFYVTKTNSNPSTNTLTFYLTAA